MPDVSYFACRELTDRTTNTYVSKQLDLWVDEFEAMVQCAHVEPGAA
jgi:hypothetical protein